MMNPQNRDHDGHERAGADDGRAASAIGVADIRLQHDREEDPGDDGADLLDAEIHQLRGGAVLPEDARQNAGGVDAEPDRQRAVADGLADVETGDPIPQRATLLRLQGTVLRPSQNAERESDE